MHHVQNQLIVRMIGLRLKCMALVHFHKYMFLAKIQLHHTLWTTIVIAISPSPFANHFIETQSIHMNAYMYDDTA